jgi:hypothetical protein
MGEAKLGEAFVKHEFDEAIAIQQAIVDAESALVTSHPMDTSRTAIEACLADDRIHLERLRTLGQAHGATGEVEEVARALTALMDETLRATSAEGSDSDYYEAHAVLLNLKRKQMDSAGGMLKIARVLRDGELRDAATNLHRGQRASSKTLATQLAAYAALIAAARGGRVEGRAAPART